MNHLWRGFHFPTFDLALDGHFGIVRCSCIFRWWPCSICALDSNAASCLWQWDFRAKWLGALPPQDPWAEDLPVVGPVSGPLAGLAWRAYETSAQISWKTLNWVTVDEKDSCWEGLTLPKLQFQVQNMATSYLLQGGKRPSLLTWSSLRQMSITKRLFQHNVYLSFVHDRGIVRLWDWTGWRQRSLVAQLQYFMPAKKAELNCFKALPCCVPV